MERALSAGLPWLTACLPLIALSNVAEGALPGLLVIVVPLVVDLLNGLHGNVRFSSEPGRSRSQSSPGPRLERALLVAYALTCLASFAHFVLSIPALSDRAIGVRVLSWAVLFGIPTLVVGHALIHSRSRAGRALGQFLFVAMGYPHFPMLHVDGHHRHVAKLEDVHSARRGETFYAFFVRYVTGETVWVLTSHQRSRIGSSMLAAGAMLVGVFLAGGGRGLVAYGVVAVLTRSIVALVNYAQHYGLERAGGEKPGIAHAWDLPHKSSNWMFFSAGFHADHHAKASLEPARQVFRATRYVLPYNIPIILPMALVPPLFFQTMNPRLDRERSPYSADATPPDFGPRVAARNAVRLRRLWQSRRFWLGPAFSGQAGRDA